LAWEEFRLKIIKASDFDDAALIAATLLALCVGHERGACTEGEPTMVLPLPLLPARPDPAAPPADPLRLAPIAQARKAGDGDRQARFSLKGDKRRPVTTHGSTSDPAEGSEADIELAALLQRSLDTLDALPELEPERRQRLHALLTTALSRIRQPAQAMEVHANEEAAIDALESLRLAEALHALLALHTDQAEKISHYIHALQATATPPHRLDIDA
jgi:hypothetical protein